MSIKDGLLQTVASRSREELRLKRRWVVNNVPRSPLISHRRSGKVGMVRQSDDRGRMKEKWESLIRSKGILPVVHSPA